MKLLFENWREFINEEVEIPAHLKRTVYRHDDMLDKMEYQHIKDAIEYFIELANDEAPIKQYEELTGAQQKIVQAVSLWTGEFFSVLRNLDSPEERMFLTQSPTISKRKMARIQDMDHPIPIQFSKDRSDQKSAKFKVTPISLDKSFKLLYIIAQLELPEKFRQPVYRGITLTRAQFYKLINSKKPTFHGNLQSWTTNGRRAIDYSKPEDNSTSNTLAVVIEIENPITGTPIMGMSDFVQEAEIIKAGSFSVISYAEEQNEKGYPYYRVKVKEINNPPENTVLDKIKATAKKMFSPSVKRSGGAGAEEYIAPKYGYAALEEAQ
jgi:hypothetical protein